MNGSGRTGVVFLAVAGSTAVAVNRQQLLELRPLLVDITVQGQTQQLSQPGQQRRWLDRLGGPELAVEKEHVAEVWQRWCEAAAALQAVEQEQARSEQQRAEQEALLEQLDALQLEDPQEQQRLELDQDRLVHGVRLQQGLALVRSAADGADQAPSLQEHCAASIQELQAMAQLDGSLLDLRDQALDLEAGLEALLRSLDQYGLSLESDPEQLDRIQLRLAELKRVQRLHGLDLAGLIEQRDGLRQRLDDGGFAADLERLRLQETTLRTQRDRANAALHQARLRVGQSLQTALLELLPPMGLRHVRFEVALESARTGGARRRCSGVSVFGQSWSTVGAPGRGASGGEMSRFLLALKTTLAGVMVPAPFCSMRSMLG